MGEGSKARLIRTNIIFGLLGASVSVIGVHAYEAAEIFGRASVASTVLQVRFTGALLGSLAPAVLCRWVAGPTVLNMLLTAKTAALAMLVFGNSVLPVTLSGDFLLGLTTGGCLVYLSTQAVSSPDGTPNTLAVTIQQASFGLGATFSLVMESLHLAPADWHVSTTVFGALLISFAAITGMAGITGIAGIAGITGIREDSGMSGVTAITAWRLSVSSRKRTERAPEAPGPRAWFRGVAPARMRTMALLYVPLYGAVFLYAGVENGWTGWLYTWLTQTAGASGRTTEPLLLLAYFWGMVTIGRSAAVLVMGKYRRIPKEVLGIASAALVALASALACLNLGFAPVLVLAVFIGPIYPAVLSIFGSLPHSGYLAIAMASLASTLGSTLVASNMGYVIRSAGPASFPVAMTALGLVLVLSMLIAAALTRNATSAHSTPVSTGDVRQVAP
ncbi:hypothetical protein [Streptomyces varsoviensis]|uniref:MFS transporter n=1 Tax=Streptomyces varsoviensis TaxID=67373 RepID=A0ABR5IR46_9ACTN|nr:hypothetical protein [Streptomyces varsoviensis]KOG40646.1 hypothetical protein ADK38_46795 [Streptomyces varsoviensis]